MGAGPGCVCGLNYTAELGVGFVDSEDAVTQGGVPGHTSCFDKVINVKSAY